MQHNCKASNFKANSPSGDKITEETPTGRGNLPLPKSWSLEGFIWAAGKEEIHFKAETLRSFPATTSLSILTRYHTKNSGEPRSIRLIVGLDDLRGIFQLQRIYDLS